MQIYAASYVLPISSPPIAGGAVGVRNGRIVAVGTVAELRKASGTNIVELPGAVITPGFVNAHTHLELTHFPAWKVRKELDYLPKTYVQWIQQVVKIKRALQPGEMELSLREGVRMSIESGTTAVGDILTDYTLAPLLGDSRLTGRLFLEAIGHDPAQCDRLLEKLEKGVQGIGQNFLPGISPHTPHTVSAYLFKGVQGLCGKLGVPKAVHLSETVEEAAFMHDTTGPIAELLYPMAHWEQYLPHPMRTTSTRFLDELGVLDSSTLAIHAVHVTPADVAILKERGVTVVLCPRSNQRLFVGCAPHRLLKSSGIALAMGTDSLASNDSLSMLDEIRYLHEIAADTFTPEELLSMATLGGARALRIEPHSGTLEPGKRADFLVFTGCGSSRDPHACLLERGRLEQVYLAGEPHG